MPKHLDTKDDHGGMNEALPSRDSHRAHNAHKALEVLRSSRLLGARLCRWKLLVQTLPQIRLQTKNLFLECKLEKKSC